MLRTEELYGVTSRELHSAIGLAQHYANCDLRIMILKQHLNEVVSKDATDPKINEITAAIGFWEQLKKEVDEADVKINNEVVTE